MKMLGRVLLTLFLLLGPSSWSVGQDSFVIRVGVVTYETFQDKDGELRALINQLSGSQNPPVRFQIASGSYREVAHWLQTGEIDLALLTAGGYVRGILQSGLIDQYEYLATMDARPGMGPWVNDSRKADKFQRYYHSVCLAHAENGELTMGDIERAAEGGTLEVLLVHPQSASGALVPQRVMQDLGIDLPEKTTRFMHSHSQVLEAIAKRRAGVTTIGFVWDDAISKQPELQSEIVKVEIITTFAGMISITRATVDIIACLLYTSPSPRDQRGSRMPASA